MVTPNSYIHTAIVIDKYYRSDVLSKEKRKDVLPKQIMFWILKNEFKYSIKNITQLYPRLSRTTITRHINTIEKQKTIYQELNNVIKYLIFQIKNRLEK